MCSAAFQATQTLSAPIQHAKSEEVGCRPSEPLDSLIGGVLANSRSVWVEYCVRFVLIYTLFCNSLFSCFVLA